ncbi:hypothetical protein AB2M62_00050 [Sphingomonas sp. MMS12-HWE2-04]|uniref:hypothetical protein n=1 Tax=Sphingomonas sp. MMS12-HWE2-04 TaxID=3234199 RepID=UPI00384FBCB1
MRLLTTGLPVTALALALAACTTAMPSRPAPPVPVPTPTPTPPPPPPKPLPADWRDWPLTPGNWGYRQDARGSIALFGRPGAEADLTLRCDRSRGRIVLARRSDALIPSLTLRTTSTTRAVAAVPAGGTPAYVAAEFGPRDATIDALGFSRGRFVVEAAGLPTLVIPAWAEILRVAEDCR